MSVSKRELRSGKVRYEVRWRENGVNRSRLLDSPKDAKAFDKEIRRLRQAGELDLELNRRRVTVADLALEWYARSEPGLARKTSENYCRQLDKRIVPEFGARRVSQLTVADVERWISKMRAGKVGDPTILHACAVLSALLSLAVRDGTVPVNVAHSARKPKQSRSRTPYLVKPDAVELIRRELVGAGKHRDVVLLEILAYAGARPESEAVALRWRQVRDRTLVIRDTKHGGTERTVVLLEPLRETLNEWRLRQGRPGPDELVIPTATGEPWTEHDWRNWRRRTFRPAVVAAGLPADLRPRDLRGSFVSLLVHEGRSIVEVARQTGHAPEVCLKDYAQVFDETDPASRRPAAETIRAARAAAETTEEVEKHAV